MANQDMANYPSSFPSLEIIKVFYHNIQSNLNNSKSKSPLCNTSTSSAFPENEIVYKLQTLLFDCTASP